jgi:predicted transcriptional regulator
MLEWLQRLQPLENGMSTNPTMGVKLDPELRERLKALGNLRQRSVHWLMREAIREYVEREEASERHDRETLERWERYQATGEHIDNEAVMAWLDTWGTDEEVECPVQHG